MYEDYFNMYEQGGFGFYYTPKHDVPPYIGVTMHGSQRPSIPYIGLYNPFELPESLTISGISNEFEKKNLSYIAKDPLKISKLKEYSVLFKSFSESIFRKFDNFIEYLSCDNGILSENFSHYWLIFQAYKETAENLMKKAAIEKTNLFARRSEFFISYDELLDSQDSSQVHERTIGELVDAMKELEIGLRNFSNHVSGLLAIVMEFINYVRTERWTSIATIECLSKIWEVLYERDVYSSDALFPAEMLNLSDEFYEILRYGTFSDEYACFSSTGDIPNEPSDPTLSINISELSDHSSDFLLTDDIFSQT